MSRDEGVGVASDKSEGAPAVIVIARAHMPQDAVATLATSAAMFGPEEGGVAEMV